MSNTKPEISYTVWAAGEIWAECPTFKEAQKAYTEALSIYWDIYRDSVYIVKHQWKEVIRGVYF